MIKRWRLPAIDREKTERLGVQTGRSALLCAVLAARGYTDAPAVEQFFSGAAGLDSPYTLIDMDKAVLRIRAAMENGERIAVYGDYDCDGITATALLVSYFQSVGADVIYYVPNREKEGYGLNTGAVDILHGQRVELIVTVDNGISAHAEIAYAASLGIDTVVTDHHTPRATLPDAIAVVDPHRADCPSRFKDLAGVGVAFKLLCALEDADGLELLEYYADLVTLGTIADVVPLAEENRVIVRHGLRSIPETENAGIRALLEVSGLAGKILTGETAAFGIIPRINASGRVGLADDVIELLLTDDAQTAAEMAAAINAQNESRKEIEEGILREIEAQLSAKPELLNGRLLLLEGKGWHHGVVGIVASKLMEKYGKPVILFSREKGLARGSGRSVPGFSLIGAVTACSEKLTRYGGHMLAAGMTLAEEDLQTFFTEMETYAAAHYPIMPIPELRVDLALTPEELTIETLQELSCLEPFGAGNEQPLFLLPGLTVEGIYPTADGKHLRLRLQFGKNLFYAVFFRMTAPAFPFSPGDRVDVVAAVSVGEWNGTPQLSVRVRDIRPQGLDEDAAILSAARYQSHCRAEYGALCPREEIAPSREDVAIVYRYLRKAGSCFYSPEALYYRLVGEGIDLCRLRIALDVLTELGLTEKSGLALRVKPDAAKVDLASSKLLSALTEKPVGA